MRLTEVRQRDWPAPDCWSRSWRWWTSRSTCVRRGWSWRSASWTRRGRRASGRTLPRTNKTPCSTWDNIRPGTWRRRPSPRWSAAATAGCDFPPSWTTRSLPRRRRHRRSRSRRRLNSRSRSVGTTPVTSDCRRLHYRGWDQRDVAARAASSHPRRCRSQT